jgi:hypothetical protein
MRVCLGASALFYPRGGHVWAYLNWALALRSVGCEVLWLESGREQKGPDLPGAIVGLRDVLAPFGLSDGLIVDTAGPLPDGCGAVPVEAAADADLLVDLAYMPREVLGRFRRTALIDIDPGLTQLWWAAGDLDLDVYGTYFTIGQGVAAGTAMVPDCGVRWRYAPPCVDLDEWPRCLPPPAGAPWTTVSHWWWDEDYGNSKKSGSSRCWIYRAESGHRSSWRWEAWMTTRSNACWKAADGA